MSRVLREIVFPRVKCFNQVCDSKPLYAPKFLTTSQGDFAPFFVKAGITPCLLYTSDAADDMQCVDLGGRRIIKKQHTRI